MNKRTARGVQEVSVGVQGCSGALETSLTGILCQLLLLTRCVPPSRSGGTGGKRRTPTKKRAPVPCGVTGVAWKQCGTAEVRAEATETLQCPPLPPA
ncbi:hypothetical protein AAFF_G00330080 [Aldrovandia affinis]|uniref:Uncharacterized protein n=1 Tax=Aldrovandia affinis TaxID=143900 RepID=A0AAD7WQ21_9TELE|nr:hypothetical protein AAFF_G00330080 [Aldrovandia affinis]